MDNITWGQISSFLIDEIAEEFEIPKSLAKNLLLNALSYNLVISEIKNQIKYTLEN